MACLIGGAHSAYSAKAAGEAGKGMLSASRGAAKRHGKGLSDAGDYRVTSAMGMWGNRYEVTHVGRQRGAWHGGNTRSLVAEIHDAPQTRCQPAVPLHTPVFVLSAGETQKDLEESVVWAALPDAESSGPSARRTGDWVFPL